MQPASSESSPTDETPTAVVTQPKERHVQLGLIEGTDKRVGPMPTSVVHGNNADLIAHIAPLYLTGSVLDVTYGRGHWWRRFQPDAFLGHDIALDGVDFRDLPYPNCSWDSVCFDPPYIPQGGTKAQDVKSVRFRATFGLQESMTQKQLDELVSAGLEECTRVARRFVLVKCMDYVNGKALWLGHLRVVNEALRLGLTVHDLYILDSGRPGPGGAQIRVIQRARRAHSYLLVFVKKGSS